MLSHRDPSLSVSSMGYIVSSQSVRATEVIGVLGMDRTACCMDPHFMMESVSIIYPCYDKGLLPQGVLFVYFDVIPEIPSSMFCAFLKLIFEIWLDFLSYTFPVLFQFVFSLVILFLLACLEVFLHVIPLLVIFSNTS